MTRLNCYLEIKNSEGKWHAFGESKTRINQNFSAIPVYEPITIDMPPYIPKGLPHDLSYELKVTFNTLKEKIREDTGKFSIKKSLISYLSYAELPIEIKNLIDDRALDGWRALPDDIKRVLFISLDNARNWNNQLL